MNESQIKQRAISGVFWKFLERMGAQLVSMIVSIILARILTPDDYSVVSIVAIFFTFCNMFINSGLSSGLVPQKKVDELDYSSVLYANIAMACLLYLLVFFGAPYVAKLYDKPILTPVMRVMGLNFFLYLIKSVFTAKISRDLEFKRFFFATIVGTIISAIVGISMALNGFGPWALVAQQSTNALVDTVFLCVVSKIRFVPKFSIKRLKPLASFSWKILVSNFVGTICETLTPLVIGLKFLPVDLAYYHKGENFPKTISNSLESIFSSVLFPTISKVNDEKSAVLRFARRFFSSSSYFIFSAMFGLMAVSENFINVILTDKWLHALPFFRIFCIYYMFYFISLGSAQIYKAIGRPDVFLKLEVIRKVLSIIVLLLFTIISSTVMVFAFAMLFIISMFLIIDSIALKKHIGYKFRYQLSDLLPNLVISFIMFVLVYIIGLANLNIFIELIIQVVVGIISYVVLSLIFKNNNLSFTVNTIKSFCFRKMKKSTGDGN